MANNSAIEWTGSTWNCIVGCSILSPGCINCYAMDEAARQIRCSAALGRETHYAGTVETVKGKAVWTGKLVMAPDHILLSPLKRKKPTTYFVNSMGDLFHENVPDEWIDKVFAVMALCPQHTFQVLTKRAKRMLEYMAEMTRQEWWKFRIYDRSTANAAEIAGWPLGVRPSVYPNWPLPNVWLGTSTERQQEADERIPELLQTPAAVRFISAEPLLGPIDLTKFSPVDDDWNPRAAAVGAMLGLHWVITGGESGHDARPSHPDWFRAIRDDCASAGVAYFHKQNGEWAPGECASKVPTRTERIATWFNEKWIFDSITPSASEETHRDDAPDVYRLGKKAAGRFLDGAEHNAMPQTN